MQAHAALLVAATISASSLACAQAAPDVRVDVTGLHYQNAVGTSDAASQGVITRQLIEDRPLLRPAEVLELVPGLIITQHSGAGKANQYFLRGFNLDHGTDFLTRVAGMPVNARTHAHGQGYTDLNFLIPELVARIDYSKGPYFAMYGDFASAGAADIHYLESITGTTGSLTGGNDGYVRALVTGGAAAGGGQIVYGVEALHNDGPWTKPEDFRKLNGVLRYTVRSGESKWGATLMGYRGRWDATDQIPRRAVDDGRLGRFDAVDETDGGRTYRYSLSGDFETKLGDGTLVASAYAIRSRLNLFSNFTYFLDDPDNGDQFEQAEQRTTWGGRASYGVPTRIGGFDMRNTIGAEFQQDRLRPVGLYANVARERLATTREDRVRETSVSAYVENATVWNDWFRTVAGLRADRFTFDVDSDRTENSGSRDDTLVSPKLSAIFGPWRKSEVFLNYGRGFHSNDARGVTTTLDPKTLEPVDPVTPLARTTGYEIGARTEIVPNVQSSLALWRLDIASELLFIGDAGTTEATRPSRRDGIEWSTRWTPKPWLLFDLDVAYTKARFRDDDPVGPFIPGALKTAVSAGATIHELGPWTASVFVRHFGPRPLVEDNSVRSPSSTIVNGHLAYRINRNFRVTLDVFNLFDRDADDITYFYTSRLPGEPSAGIDDLHFHPAEPRSFRLGIVASF
jgi:outer membrane receptor protein involved in Fe transport